MYYKKFLELPYDKVNNIKFHTNNSNDLYNLYIIYLQINTYIDFENILKYHLDENIYKSDNIKESIVIIKNNEKYIFYNVINKLDFNPYTDLFLSINQFVKDYNLDYIDSETNNFYTLYEYNIIKKSSFIYLYKNLEIKFIKLDQKSSLEDKIKKINNNKLTNKIHKIIPIIKIYCHYTFDYEHNNIFIATICYDFILYKNILRFNNLEKFNKNILFELIEFIKNDTNKNQIYDEIIKIY
jgi:hypothetical protein